MLGEQPPTTLMTREIPVEPVFYERPLPEPAVVTHTAVETVERTTSEEPVRRQAPPVRQRLSPSTAVFGIAMLVGILIAFTVDHPAKHARTHAAVSGASSSNADVGQPSAGARAAPNSQATPTTAGATPTTVASGHAVLLEVKRDQGSKGTQHFVIPGPRWTLGWAYDCSQQGGNGSFKVTILNADGTPSKDGGVDQQGAKGSSVAAYASSGERYLSVQTPCLWAIRVTT
jgi:hypothetical protein